MLLASSFLFLPSLMQDNFRFLCDTVWKNRVFWTRAIRNKVRWYSLFQPEVKLHSWFSNSIVNERKVIVFLNRLCSGHKFLLWVDRKRQTDYSLLFSELCFYQSHLWFFSCSNHYRPFNILSLTNLSFSICKILQTFLSTTNIRIQCSLHVYDCKLSVFRRVHREEFCSPIELHNLAFGWIIPNGLLAAYPSIS